MPSSEKQLVCPKCNHEFLRWSEENKPDLQQFEIKPICQKCNVEAVEVTMNKEPDPRHLC